MADVTFEPMVGYEITRIGPKTLVSEYEDGTEHRRQKSSVVKRLFRARYRLNKSDADTFFDLYGTKGMNTTLSIVTYDANDTASHETNVFFFSPPSQRVIAAGGQYFEILAEYVEDV